MYSRPLRIASRENIKKAWFDSRDARGNGGARGLDNVTARGFRERLETNILNLRAKILNHEYQFQDLKPHFIDKGDGTQRIICVPTVEDRLVQRIILRNLTLDCDKLDVLTDVSFGIKKGRDQGVHSAVRKALQTRQEFPWVLKTDVSKFFDRIDRDDLKKKVKARLGKSSVVPLILNAIDCEVKPENSEDAKIIAANGIERGLGVRQGMPLSPLLSNLVLNNFDRKINRKGIKLIRYADDIIAFASSQEECEEILMFVEKELERVKLSIPSIKDEKTKTVIRPPDAAVTFLGVEIYMQGGNGYSKRIPKTTMQRAVNAIRQHSDLAWNIKNGYNFAKVTQRLKDIPDGYKSAFAGCSNLAALQEQMKQEALKVRNALVKDIFGSDVIERLTDEQKTFMGFPV